MLSRIKSGIARLFDSLFEWTYMRIFMKSYIELQIAHLRLEICEKDTAMLQRLSDDMRSDVEIHRLLSERIDAMGKLYDLLKEKIEIKNDRSGCGCKDSKEKLINFYE